jgi:type IV pilus assembly protein PilO
MANIDLNEWATSVGAQFNELNGVHPGLWPIVPRVLCGVALAIAVVVLGWVGYWADQQDELARGEQEEVQLKESYKQKMAQAISLDALKEQRQLVQQYVVKMEKQLPSKAEMDALVKEIGQSGQGGKNKVQFALFKPGAIVVKDYYAEQPIDIKLVGGGYHDIGEFVADVAKLSRIVTLNNLAITSDKDGLVLDVLAKTFRYLDPEEVASQAAEKAKAKKGEKK